MGFVMFMIVLAGGGYAAWRRARRNPMLRLLSAGMNGWAESCRKGPELERRQPLILIPTKREVGDRFEEREVLASRLVA